MGGARACAQGLGANGCAVTPPASDSAPTQPGAGLARWVLAPRAGRAWLVHPDNRPLTPALFQDPPLLAESSNVLTQDNEGLAKAQPVCKDTRVGRNDLCPCGSGKKYKACGSQ